MKPLTKEDIRITNKNLLFSEEITGILMQKVIHLDSVLSAVKLLKQELKKDIDKDWIDEDYIKMERLIDECFPIAKEDAKVQE